MDEQGRSSAVPSPPLWSRWLGPREHDHRVQAGDDGDGGPPWGAAELAVRQMIDTLMKAIVPGAGIAAGRLR